MKNIIKFLSMSALVLAGANTFAAQWQTVDQAGMEVHLYKPDTQPALNGKRALMISLHGCAVNTNGAQWMQDYANWQDTADKYGMIIALPAAPDGGAYGSNCWDWKPTEQTKDSNYNKNIFELVDTLKGDSGLNIDSHQVYITGLSSGGGQALIAGCLAPDVFAGVGLSAAPPVGNGEINNYDVKLIAQACKDYAGDKVYHFGNQIVSVITGSEDDMVPSETQESIALAMQDIYLEMTPIDNASSKLNIENESFPQDWGWTWNDGYDERVVYTKVEGMGHAWAAGGGEGNEWADTSHINYPAHVTEWFFNNNTHTGFCNDSCKITHKITVTSETDGKTAKIFGYVRGLDSELAGAAVTIQLLDTVTQEIQTHKTNIFGDYEFEIEISDLQAGDYEATVITFDGTKQSTGVIRIDDDTSDFDFAKWWQEIMSKWFGGYWS